MINRSCLVSLALLSCVAISGKASAELVVSPMGGMPATSSSVNSSSFQIWVWAGDYMRRPNVSDPPPDPPPPARAYWIIPLTYQGDGGTYAWWAQVMVSTGTRCSLKWRGATLPTVNLTTTSETEATSDGPLTLTDGTKCPGGDPSGCNHNLTSAFVWCSLKPGGYVGAVSYQVTSTH